MKKIFITGASGFVGKVLTSELRARNISYLAGVRTKINESDIAYGIIENQSAWGNLLKDVSTVVHLAARVHVMNETNSDPLEAFRKTNCEATIKLAKSAKEAGVQKFIFISSIKVNGEKTLAKPFFYNDTPKPEDPYGISKMEAENELLKLHEKEVFDVVIIRPPLIYGPGVKANFKNLMNLVSKRIPLPFGRAFQNQRSLVSVYNLVDLIILCSSHKNAGGEIFLVSDDHDLSLKDLIINMGKVVKVRPLLIPVPLWIIKFSAKILGKESVSDRLFGNLQVDISHTKERLNWHPRYGFIETFGENENQQ